MFGHFKFSRMNGILWECGTAERSEASTALIARTRVRERKNGNLRCRNQSAACAAHSIWVFIPIHVDLPISSFPFFLLLLSQAVTFIFIHHIAKLYLKFICSMRRRYIIHSFNIEGAVEDI